MCSSPVPVGRTTRTALVLAVLLIAGVGITAAAVSGDFSSSYDGYDDGSDTDVRGHEIQVSGTVEFTGVTAVEPKITVHPSDHTVLDYATVDLRPPAETSVNFDRQYLEDGVRFSAAEIPAGTQLELTFVLYPVSGLSQSEINSAEVFVAYETPGGESQQKSIDVTTSLSNTPETVIRDLKQGPVSPQIPLLGIYIPSEVVWLLASFGLLSLLYVVIKALGGKEPPEPPGV